MNLTLVAKREAELAEEYYTLNQATKKMEKRKEEIAEELKMRTGEREAGNYLINVSSSSRESVDTEACKAILGHRTPIKISPVVRLTVVPA